ncbi:hypothetical protein ACFSQQ_11310 [Mesorhizobium kowhaii]|uniref:hypothetical protein n=1 Tax=Mesorhizobium kowhaii TaxID=1300272 RepID=UPI0035EE6B2C
MDRTKNQRPIDKVMKDVVAWREAGYVNVVGRLLDEARANADLGSTATEVGNHQAWFDRAIRHEREYGAWSLVNEQHSLHLKVMEIVNSVKDWN